jgi:flagellar biosynthesis protein FlhG
MMDQATELRRLMLTGRTDAGGAVPRTFVIAGGKPGVGATTLAVSLAATLAHDGQRVVLIDADLHQAEVASQAGVAATLGIGDVLAGRKGIHEALIRGPAGMQVLAGTASDESRGNATPRAINRLLRQLRSVAPHADWLLVDAGNQPGELPARLWSAAEQVLLVTSTEAAAVMDTYALVKTLLKRQSLRAPLALVVNQAADQAEASDVCRRIDQSCRRFLGLSVPLAGWLPCDGAITPAGARELPAVLQQPEGVLARATSRLAEFAVAAHRRAAAPQRMAA